MLGLAADLPLPFGAYGVREEATHHEVVVVSGATIWTGGPEGVIRDGALVVDGGKVAWVGPDGPELEAAVARLGSRTAELPQSLLQIINAGKRLVERRAKNEQFFGREGVEAKNVQ